MSTGPDAAALHAAAAAGKVEVTSGGLSRTDRVWQETLGQAGIYTNSIAASIRLATALQEELGPASSHN